ncbi:hypothetical protein ACFE04_009761 [Oxalis oulophora]
MEENYTSSSLTSQQKPTTLTLPPRPSLDSLFSSSSSSTGGGLGLGGAFGLSPGPMTLVSSFFSSDFDNKYSSFSQLLSGDTHTTSSPATATATAFSFNIENEEQEETNGGGFKMSRPMSLVVGNNNNNNNNNNNGNVKSPVFMVPPGLSPSGLLNSPLPFNALFSPQFFASESVIDAFIPLKMQSPFGMSHQQALAQVTAQAVFAQSQFQMQAGYQQASSASEDFLTNYSSSTPDEDSQQQVLPSTSEPENYMMEPSEVSYSNRKSYQPSVVDKPADDGYNWRKYGQKPIKGSEYPRSYYKCTLQNCPVKKKVERSSDGQITEIIYKGQHNHDKPQTNKRGKDSSNPNVNVNSEVKLEVALHGNIISDAGRILESHQLVPVHSLESSDSEGEDARTREEDENDDEPNPKRRNTTGASEVPPPKKTVAEPKIIVQTRSEVDLLDDGFRWRKYGQKVVKGNPHPRSYYKCTSAGCNVRKHVERASTDPKAVITTYEGKHNHGLPQAKNSSHNNTSHNNDAQLQKMTAAVKRQPHKGMDFENSDKRPVLLRLKEEQIKV